MTQHTTPQQLTLDFEVVPAGLCQCGCGQRTTIAPCASTEYGYVKGQPRRYLSGHDKRIFSVPEPNPSGLCQCGCGEPTALAPYTCQTYGWVRGKPKRFILGHSSRKRTPAYEVRECGYSAPCWVWLRCKSKGYGELGVYNSTTKRATIVRAHRYFYEQRYGAIPAGLGLDHLCRNKACVNPDHLEAVTQRVNSRRGKHCKLSDADVLAIFRATDATRSDLVAKYGVSTSTIGKIQRGVTRTDITKS